ncbi:LysR family transcriptional regulator [Chitinimonas naiadis]
MDQFQAIRVFARVVETGSFTKAADTLNMPKATVSKVVQMLEAHLQVPLLLRTTRKVTVTPDGASYYTRTAPLVRELDDINNSLSHSQASPKGKVKVDTGASIASMVIIPALPEFLHRYPDIQLELGVSDRPVDLISENVDCVIRGGPLTDLSLIARPLGMASWTTCASPAYLRRHGIPAHPSELRDRHKLVAYLSARTGRELPARFQRGKEVLEIEGNAVVSINESNAHLAAGLAGLGVIHSFSYTVQPHIARGELVPILQDWQPAPYPFHVVYPPNRNLSNRVRVFIDWLTEVFARIN